MTLDLGALEATAKAATPGPWRWDEDFGENGDTGLALTNDARAEVVGAYNWHCCSFRDDPTVEDNDAEHIAAFDPPTVLALIAKLREAERQRDASEKQVDIRSKDSIAARIARSNVRAVEEWAATQALVARQTRYIEELERVDSVELKAKLREAEAVIAQILDYEGPEAADMRDIALTYKPTNQEESAS